ncbi:MAG: hypothetical protein H6673_10790 [Anaerolineales bacterium]|nr:hypothetical protein [Anaerolineales bacterium]
MRKKLWQIGAAVVLLAVLGGGALAYLGAEARVMQLDVDATQIVIAGQPFDVWITLENTSDNEQEIVSIGVEDNVQVVEMVPAYRTTEEHAPWLEYVFARQRRPILAADERMRLHLRLVAPQTGTATTEVTIWYNNHVRSDYVIVEYTAVPHPAPWLGR